MLNKNSVSLDLSKRLSELDILVDSEFVWIDENKDNSWKRFHKEHWNAMSAEYGNCSNWSENRHYQAPLANELIGLLPHQYHIWYSDGDGINGWCCVRFSEPELDSSYEHWETADTMPNVIAKMLIYLKEQGGK